MGEYEVWRGQRKCAVLWKQFRHGYSSRWKFPGESGHRGEKINVQPNIILVSRYRVNCRLLSTLKESWSVHVNSSTGSSRDKGVWGIEKYHNTVGRNMPRSRKEPKEQYNFAISNVLNWVVGME